MSLCVCQIRVTLIQKAGKWPCLTSVHRAEFGVSVLILPSVTGNAESQTVSQTDRCDI